MSRACLPTCKETACERSETVGIWGSICMPSPMVVSWMGRRQVKTASEAHLSSGAELMPPYMQLMGAQICTKAMHCWLVVEIPHLQHLSGSTGLRSHFSAT